MPVIAKADRSTQLIANLNDYQTDSTLVNDVGLDWRNLQPEDQWHKRAMTGGTSSQFSKFSYNTHQHGAKEATQWGDTGMIPMHEARPRMLGKAESDPTKLDRWTSVGTQGRQGYFTGIMAAHQPCKNTRDSGSSYQQQL